MLFYHLVQNHGRKKTMTFLKKVLRSDILHTLKSPTYISSRSLNSTHSANQQNPKLDCLIRFEFDAFIEAEGQRTTGRRLSTGSLSSFTICMYFFSFSLKS